MTADRDYLEGESMDTTCSESQNLIGDNSIEVIKLNGDSMVTFDSLAMCCGADVSLIASDK